MTLILPSSIIIIAITVYAPWYLIPVVSFVLGYSMDKPGISTFLIGLIIPFVVWCSIAFMRDIAFEKSIATIVSNLLGNIGEPMIFIITGLSIGVVSGLAALSGHQLKRMKVKII